MSAIIRPGRSRSTRALTCTAELRPTARGSAVTPTSAAPTLRERDNSMAREKRDEALLSTLGAEHAEWRPLLALVDAALHEMERAVWVESVPAREPSAAIGEPLLSGATIRIAPGPVHGWVHRAITIAGAGASVTPFAEALTGGKLDPMALFEAAVAQDQDRLDDFGRAAGDDRGVLKVVGPIVAMPMLHACRQAWTPLVSAAWAEGYCPICGGWPALAEARGLDGQRRLRCGRCGGDWRTEWLRCPFCGERGHEHLGSLVPEGSERRTVDVCERCRHYVKAVTSLAPIRPDDVILQDLATLVLDVVALKRGYGRPAAKRRPVEVVSRPSWLRTIFRRPRMDDRVKL
jgi:FdhE protein